MKHLTALLASLLVVAVAFFVIARAFAQAAPAPRNTPPEQFKGPVSVEPGLVDFGVVKHHTEVNATVKLVNTSDRPLTILKAVPSCQCTTVDLDGKVIPARGELKFPVHMKVSSTGQKLASVKIAVEGMREPLEVKLQAEVAYAVRAYRINPKTNEKEPFIDAYSDPAAVKGEITVVSTDQKPFRVLSLTGKPPVFVDWDPSKPPQNSYRVKYDISAPDCTTMLPYMIVETDHPDAPLVDMRVRHLCTRIQPKFDFAEFRADGGVINSGQPGTFDIEIKKAQTPGGAIQVVAVESTRPDIDAALVSKKFDGSSILATVRLTPKPGAKGVMLFPVRFTFLVPDKSEPVTDTLLVFCKVQ